MIKIISLFALFAALSPPLPVTAQQQCVPYLSAFTFPNTQYPDIWKKPTATIFNTAEFKTLNSSINWSLVPNIPPKQQDATGAFISANYPASDPDCWWTYKTCVTPKAPGLKPDVSFCPEPNTLGLTYDDGPNCTDSTLYDMLKQNNQKVTLFYIGSNVADWPKEAQRGYADGHQVCVHTWSHPYMTTLTNQEVLGELYYSRKAIKTVIGITPLCWRPPFGDVDDRVRAIAQQLNLSTIIWNQDSDDWQMVPAGTQPQSFVDGNYQTFVDRANNGTFSTQGSIILSHELNAGTISEAIKWYPMLKAAYKNIVPVASCLNITQPYAETNVTYPTFAQLATSGGSNISSSSNGSSPSSPTSKSSASVLGATAVVGLMVMLSVFVIL